MSHHTVNNLTYKIAIILVGVPFLRSKYRVINVLYLVWITLWGLNLVNIAVLSISDLIAGKYAELLDDFAFLTAHSLASIASLLFSVYYKEWENLLNLLTVYHPIFGVPPGFNKMQSLSELMGKASFTYLNVGTFAFAVFMILDEERCNQQYKGERICGMLNPTWWPPHIAVTVLRKRLFLVYQFLSYHFLACSLFVCCLVYQSVRYIENNANHISKLYVKLCHGSYDIGELKRLVDYHEETLNLCRQLNWVFRRTVGHVSLIVAVTIASHGYQVVREHNAKASLYVVAYLILITILCHSGQKMEDAMTKIGDSVYCSEWYECDNTIKYITWVVLLRTQARVGLDALPIGNVNHLLLVSVAKATYSYLTLLQQTTQ